jgi:hypothetical protein
LRSPDDLRPGQALPAQPLDLGGDAACRLFLSSSTPRTMRRRLCGVVRAVFWMFIPGSGLLAPVSQSRSG